MKVYVLATRIANNDGVTLETKNWKKILKKMGHRVTFVAGKLDEGGILIPELHFQSPDAARLYEKVIFGQNNYKQVEAEIFAQAGVIEGKLRDLLRRRKPDLLLVPNVLSLPMHFPFAVALTRVLHDVPIPTVARHHDFWWERKRFRHSSMFEFFKHYFPPDLPNIAHVVINSDSAEKLMDKTGLSSTVIWDTIDFNKTYKKDGFASEFRADMGLSEDDCVFLQATRIIPRKRIELAIKLLEKLNDPKCVLVIAGHAGDEGVAYEKYLRELADKSPARVVFIGDRVNSIRRVVEYKSRLGKIKRKRIYKLWDCYLNADFVTYPTKLEGFGNQFVEAMFFKKPIIVTPYKVYKKDIRLLGFKTIEMSEKISQKTIDHINKLRRDKNLRKKMVDHNFELGKKYLSYEWSERRIRQIMNSLEK